MASMSAKPNKNPKLRAGVPSESAYHWRLFEADWNAHRIPTKLRNLGKTAEQAFAVWWQRRMSGKSATPAPSPRPVAGPVRAAPRPTRRPPAPATTYRYQPGHRLVGRMLPGWPVFECRRPTNDTPGVSTAWVMVGREA
jgi:hypothetical protein